MSHNAMSLDIGQTLSNDFFKHQHKIFLHFCPKYYLNLLLNCTLKSICTSLVFVSILFRLKHDD